MTEIGGSGGLEIEIAQLERDLALKREELEKKKESGEIAEMPHDKETLRQVIGEKIQSFRPPAGQGEPAAGYQPPAAGLPSYLSADLKDKVQELTDTAFTKSISDAVKEARATGNAALIDAFHDALVDELYDYLIERGKLKKI